MSVRVRIGPSPTGVPHIGVTRTALFNFLFAKRQGGKFILRIEDTDQERLVPGSLGEIFQILKFLDLFWDEGPEVGGPYGPYVQSERLAIYQEYAKKLIDSSKAYFCFCTPKHLEKMRREQQKKGLAPKYDRTCLSLSKKEIAQKIISKTPHAIRLKIPDSGETSWKDLIHGKISFKNELLDDHIILKSDGWPTYHLASVLDDHLMKITHVLRGDEWISSTPKHVILYQALGFTPPQFGHLPTVLGGDKKKLAKRHGAKSVLEYKDQGYLKEALINFMALLGWSPKTDKELFSLEELAKTFDLSGINPTSPIFNLEKLTWFNKQWIMKLTDSELVKRLENFVPKNWDRQLLKRVLPLVKVRIANLADFPNWTNFFFEEVETNFGSLEKNFARSVLESLARSFIKLSSWNFSQIEKSARGAIGKVKPKEAFHILRLVVTGKSVGPPLFESLEILGKEKTLKRISHATKLLS